MSDFKPMVPFMPKEPQLFHSYVPYQLDTEEYPLDEALEKGSLYINLFSPYDISVKPGDCLC